MLDSAFHSSKQQLRYLPLTDLKHWPRTDIKLQNGGSADQPCLPLLPAFSRTTCSWMDCTRLGAHGVSAQCLVNGKCKANKKTEAKVEYKTVYSVCLSKYFLLAHTEITIFGSLLHFALSFCLQTDPTLPKTEINWHLVENWGFPSLYSVEQHFLRQYLHRLHPHYYYYGNGRSGSPWSAYKQIYP